MSDNEKGFYLDPASPEIESHFAWLADHGIKCVGAPCHPGHDDHVIRRFTRLLEQHDMRMASLHGVPLLLAADGDDLAHRNRFTSLFERARLWRAEALIVHFRSLQIPWYPGVWWEVSAYIEKNDMAAFDARQDDMLEWLSQEAGRAGTMVALENLPQFYSYSYEVRDIAGTIRRTGLPHLGVCLDTGHAHAGSTPVPIQIMAAGKTLLTTHLHDNLGWHGPRHTMSDTDLHLVPGLGTINWASVLKAFRDVRYTGPFIYEDPKLPGSDDPLKAWDLTLKNWTAFEALDHKLNGKEFPHA